MTLKNRLIENMTSLFILQGLIYLFPLITYPYLIRVLGPEKFGLLAFAQAFVQYFNIFTDYGFNMTVPREIAIHREDKDRISSIFVATMLVKLGLLLLSAIVYAAIIVFIPYFHDGWIIYLVYFFAVIGNVFIPAWFFQGLEQMKYITLVIFIARVITTVATFVFVRSSNDVILAACFQSGVTLLCAFLSMGLLWKRKLINLRWTSDWSGVKAAAKESNQVFLSNLSISLYSYGSVVIVGLVSGQTVAGYYSIIQKFSTAVVGLVQPITQGLYPSLSRQFQDSQEKYYKSQRLLLILGGFIAMSFGALTFTFAEPISKLLAGEASAELMKLMQIFSTTTAFTILNVFLLSSVLVMKLYDEMQSLFLKVAFLFLALSFPITYQFGYEGIAYLILAAEVIVSLNIFRLLSVAWNRLSFGERSN